VISPALDQLRRSIVSGSGGAPAPLRPDEFALYKACLDVLGIGLEPVFTFVSRTLPDAAAFDAWVTDQLGGPPDPDRLRRADRIWAREPPTAAEVEWQAHLARAPRVLSDADLAFWDEHGYVIVRAAAPEAARSALERAIREHLAAHPQLQQGIMIQLFRADGIDEIHGSIRIQTAFAQLLGTTDLVMTTDRCGFNPPLRPGQSWGGMRLHLDLDAYTPPIPLGVQGILYLTDTAEDQGAFRCVAGFHHRIDDWLRGLDGRDPNAEDLERFGPTSIAAAGGDLIIWNSALPHGSQPNRSRLPRIVHYLTMYPTP
jgi:hypothetical protein